MAGHKFEQGVGLRQERERAARDRQTGGATAVADHDLDVRRIGIKRQAQRFGWRVRARRRPADELVADHRAAAIQLCRKVAERSGPRRARYLVPLERVARPRVALDEHRVAPAPHDERGALRAERRRREGCRREHPPRPQCDTQLPRSRHRDTVAGATAPGSTAPRRSARSWSPRPSPWRPVRTPCGPHRDAVAGSGR